MLTTRSAPTACVSTSQSMRVGVLLLKAVELFQALGGLLDAQAHATQELPHPIIPGTHVKSLCIEPIVQEASNRDRAQAQDVGYPHEVLAQSCRVCGRQRPSRCCSWRAPLPAVRSVRVDPVELSGEETLDLAYAPLHVPSSFCPPLVQHVEEPVADGGIDVDLAAL